VIGRGDENGTKKKWRPLSSVSTDEGELGLDLGNDRLKK